MARVGPARVRITDSAGEEFEKANTGLAASGGDQGGREGGRHQRCDLPDRALPWTDRDAQQAFVADGGVTDRARSVSGFDRRLEWKGRSRFRSLIGSPTGPPPSPKQWDTAEGNPGAPAFSECDVNAIRRACGFVQEIQRYFAATARSPDTTGYGACRLYAVPARPRSTRLAPANEHFGIAHGAKVAAPQTGRWGWEQIAFSWRIGAPYASHG